MFRLATRRTASIARSFSTTAAKRDLVQDLYLKEIKNFKPTPATAADADAVVQKWSVPKAPQPPTFESADATKLSEYESQPVEVESATVAEGESAPASSMEDWFVVEDTFAESKEHH